MNQNIDKHLPSIYIKDSSKYENLRDSSTKISPEQNLALEIGENYDPNMVADFVITDNLTQINTSKEKKTVEETDDKSKNSDGNLEEVQEDYDEISSSYVVNPHSFESSLNSYDHEQEDKSVEQEDKSVEQEDKSVGHRSI